jgi:putative transposase
MVNRGRTASRRRVGRLMREAELACKTKRKFKAMTNSGHDLPIAPNQLDREFNVHQPNQVYVGDITYIHTQEGWLYLAVVIDLYSRQVVGWSMAEHMRTKLVNDALMMAIWQRKPAKGLLWHSDRGSQYASESHRALLKQHRIRQRCVNTFLDVMVQTSLSLSFTFWSGMRSEDFSDDSILAWISSVSSRY